MARAVDGGPDVVGHASAFGADGLDDADRVGHLVGQGDATGVDYQTARGSHGLLRVPAAGAHTGGQAGVGAAVLGADREGVAAPR